jgi:hypothetical protein
LSIISTAFARALSLAHFVDESHSGGALSYDLHGNAEHLERSEFEARITQVVQRVFNKKQITKRQASLMGDDALASAVLSELRANDVLQIEGQTRSARYVFTDRWAYHDHEVSGIV